MILGIIGFLVLIFSTTKDTGVSVGGIIFGVVLILLGLSMIDYMHEEKMARINRRRYWAYGELPGERPEQRRNKN